jgi:uncharacterized tellurite resistance protein B-like protein
MITTAMFQRLLALFDGDKAEDAGRAAADPLQRAAAVLLVIAARMDGRMGEAERASILRLLETRFAVADAPALLEEADREAEASTDFFSVTRIINERLAPERRESVIEMLWEVALADGVVDDYEASLIRRVAGLLHVADRDAGDARKRASERDDG